MKAPAKILVLCSLFLSGSSLWGQIIYSGVQNIAIPLDVTGVYLDIDTGTFSATESSVPGWDFNPLFGGFAIRISSTSFSPARAGNTNTDAILSFDSGELINMSAGDFVAGPGGSSTHLGVADDQFFIGQPSYLGYQFVPSGGGGSVFGWMKVTLTNNTNGAIIHDWAYESSGSGIIAGAIPEPGTYAVVLGLLALGFVWFRRSRFSRFEYIKNEISSNNAR